MSEETSAITLYVPFNLGHRSQWRVLEGRHTIGVFASRPDSLNFALRLADTIRQRRAEVVRLLVEESDGRWVQVAPQLPVDDEPALSDEVG
jgi:hypothetical protein